MTHSTDTITRNQLRVAHGYTANYFDEERRILRRLSPAESVPYGVVDGGRALREYRRQVSRERRGERGAA